MSNFETIKLDKGLYGTGKSFASELEKIDPSENYKGTSLEGLDAFERQLKRFDIKIKGALSSPVEKFFSATDSAVLFPEYVSRAVRQGVEEANIIDSIVAAKTNINALDYRTICSDTDVENKILANVSEGAFIPETAIKTQDHLVKLHKRGRMLVASYEAIRFQRLDLFSVALRQIGSFIAQAQLIDATNVLVNGDGNDNPAMTIPLSVQNELSYTDIVNLWTSLSPYEFNTMLTSTKVISKILMIPEFRDAAAGLNFHGSGKMITPLGANLFRTPYLNDIIIGFDKNYALEMVTAGGIETDFDRLIDRQLERASITQICGFAKIFNEPVKLISL